MFIKKIVVTLTISIIVIIIVENKVTGVCVLVSGRAYWYEEATKALRLRLKGVSSTSDLQARNIVLLVGDGLGVTTSTAARIFKGQRDGHNGEEAQLSWDKFPAVALAKVRTRASTLTHIRIAVFCQLFNFFRGVG